MNVPVAVKGKVPVGAFASPLLGCTVILNNAREDVAMLLPPQPVQNKASTPQMMALSMSRNGWEARTRTNGNGEDITLMTKKWHFFTDNLRRVAHSSPVLA